ncbi:MAG: SAM-dependent DNA methyltransferase, partial [Candidatus Hermodarchaeota archaeon]
MKYNFKEVNNINELDKKKFRRTFGAHLTSIEVFEKYIVSEIKDKLYDYVWVDLYAGEGNLILPILELVPNEKRIAFFKDHIYLFDIQPEMINKCVKNANYYGIPSKIAQENIKYRNNLENFPKFLLNDKLPIYHITNPPYLYLGYIRKHE